MEGRFVLVPKYLARAGEKFQFVEYSSRCFECKYRAACVEGLVPGRVYLIKDVKDKELECPIHGLMVPAKVVVSDLEVAIPAKIAVRGATIIYNRPWRCSSLTCKYYSACFPVGVIPGDRIKIEELLEEVPPCEHFDEKRVSCRVKVKET